MLNDKIQNAEILGNGRSSNDREGKENDLKDSRKRQQRERSEERKRGRGGERKKERDRKEKER
jgi:hypothetical protein